MVVKIVLRPQFFTTLANHTIWDGFEQLVIKQLEAKVASVVVIRDQGYE